MDDLPKPAYHIKTGMDLKTYYRTVLTDDQFQRLLKNSLYGYILTEDEDRLRS